MAENKYHVMARVSGGWKVIKSGSARASKTFNTQHEAIKYAKNISRLRHSDLAIHGKDGRLQEKTTFSAETSRANGRN